EGEEEAAQEGDERVRVRRVRLHLLRGRPHLCVSGQDRTDCLYKLRVGDFRLRRDRDLVQLPSLTEEGLSGREIEPRKGGTPDREARAELGEPRDSEGLDRSLYLDADVLARLQVLLRRRLLVDDHLSSPGPRARDEAEWVEARPAVRDRKAEVRRAA